MHTNFSDLYTYVAFDITILINALKVYYKNRNNENNNAHSMYFFLSIKKYGVK